jgi:hypothetical protein
MTHAMLQNRYCVAVVQHRLSYNGSIATSPPSGEGSEMGQRRTARPPQDRPRLSRSRIRRAAIAVAGLASLILVACACGAGSPNASRATTPTTGAGTSNTGIGAVTRSASNAGSGSAGNESTGSYSVAFAECMRAHGVPKFPNPNGSEGQLGPDSGVNPASPAFQAALSGPCKSLAPAAWVSSGQVTNGGGS